MYKIKLKEIVSYLLLTVKFLFPTSFAINVKPDIFYRKINNLVLKVNKRKIAQ